MSKVIPADSFQEDSFQPDSFEAEGKPDVSVKLDFNPPPSGGGFTGSMSDYGRLLWEGVKGLGADQIRPMIDAATKAHQQAWSGPQHPLQSILDDFKRINNEPFFNPNMKEDFMKLWHNTIGSLIKAPFDAHDEMKKAENDKDPFAMMHGLGRFITSVLPFTELTRGAIESPSARTAVANATTAAQDRIASSLIQPDKTSFDFGADPVEAAKQVPPSANIKMMRGHVQSAIDQAQAEVQQHIADRNAAAAEVGASTGIDIKPYLEAAADRAKADAFKAGNGRLAVQIDKTKNALLKSFEGQYGGSYLEPNQIINEKQSLANDTRFVEEKDTVGQNLNKARMEMYKAMDGALNRMFGSDQVTGVESPVKTANQRIASNIELDRLLERKEAQQMKAPLLGRGGIVSRVIGGMPETAPKTVLNRVLGGGQPAAPTPNARAYEFFEPKKVGPYESGYKGAGGVTPGPAVNVPETGPYRPGTPADVAAPETLGGVKEGTPYRPGTPAGTIGPSTLGEVKEGTPYKPGEKADVASPETLSNGREEEIIVDPYTGRARGYSNPNLPVRVQGREMPAYTGGDTNLESKTTVTAGEKLNKDLGGGISTVDIGGKSYPKVPTSGPAKGMTLSHVEEDPLTGKPSTYIYTDATGRKLRFSLPQK